MINAHGGALFSKPSFVVLIFSVLSIGIAVGIVTPIIGVAGALSRAALLISIPTERSALCAITLILCVVVSILGAGAYSFDGVLFGRRRIIL